LNYDEWQFPDSVCDKTPEFDVEHVSRDTFFNESDAYTFQKSAMNGAMKKVETLGAKVTFDAPLMSMDSITKTYNTVTQAQIGSKSGCSF
jgi:hypothetical protein